MSLRFHPQRAHAKSSAGFTILELMIATIIFSLILLVAAAGILRFSNDYYKGLTSTNTQAVARTVMSDVVQTIQFSQSVTPLPTGASKPTGFCIDDSLYSFKIGQEVSPSLQQDALVKRTGNCTSATPSVGTPRTLNTAIERELLSEHMRLGQFSIEPVGASTKAYKVDLTVVYGNADDLFVNDAGDQPPYANDADWATVKCRINSGLRFCAVSHLTTIVQQRL
jgi:prepilin-type N-terminal cleavage/methylation domain-containing protein